jgi:hypothetical protein
MIVSSWSMHTFYLYIVIALANIFNKFSQTEYKINIFEEEWLPFFRYKRILVLQIFIFAF